MNKNVHLTPNPLYNNDNKTITRINVLYESFDNKLDGKSTQNNIYEEISFEKSWLYGFIYRKESEKFLLNYYKKIGSSNNCQIWLVRKKEADTIYILSILYYQNYKFIFKHLKIEKSLKIDGSLGNHFIINSNIRLYMCTTIFEVINVLQKCIITSQRISGKNEIFLYGTPCIC